jgi:hypothetical protein
MMWQFNIKTDGTKEACLVGRGDTMIPLVDFDPDAVYCGNVAACSIKIAVTIASMCCLVMRPSRCISHYLSQSWIPCIHQDPSRVSRTTRFRHTGHRQFIRFSTRRPELLHRVRQVPRRSRIQEHSMGPQALLQVDSGKETDDHYGTQR